MDLSYTAILESEPALLNAMRYHFGSYEEGLRAAGFEPVKVRRHRLWNKAQVLAELEERRRLGKDLSSYYMRRHDATLFEAMYGQFGSYITALKAAGIDPAIVKRPRNTVWTPDYVLREIREFYSRWWKDHPRDQAPRPCMQKTNSALANAAVRYFGSVIAGVKAAGFDPVPRVYRQWTRQTVLSALQVLHRKCGPLTHKAIFSADRHLGHAMVRLYGHPRAAAKAAGVAYVRKKPSRQPVDSPPLGREELIAKLREHRAKQRSLGPRSLKNGFPRVWEAITRLFPSYESAISAAGIEPKRQKWSRLRVVECLKQRSAAGKALNIGAILKDDVPLSGAIQKYLHSHNAALRAAGFDPAACRLRRHWTKKVVLAELRRRLRHGEDLSYGHARHHAVPLQGAMVRHFGSYTKALKAAGIDPKKFQNRRHPKNHIQLRHWTEDLVLKTLKNMHASGQDLRFRTMKEKHQPPFWAAVKLFGSYINALREAGIDYWTMSQTQLALQRERIREQQAKNHSSEQADT
jgi:hypothetical protein